MQGFLEYTHFKYIVFGVLVLLSVFMHIEMVNAATIRTYSDLISTSAPGASANHTINFTTVAAIPPGGFIRFTPDPDDFDIPTVDFDFDNVELFVETTPGNYVLRSATTTGATATDDNVTITTGTSGNIEFVLNSTEGISANTKIRIKIGDHTTNGSTTLDVGITNPATPGTYDYFLEAGDGVTNTRVRGHYAIIEQVRIQDVDTREFIPPFRFNGAPSGRISGTSLNVQFSLETDEFALCRYSIASNTPYFSMSNEFSTNFTIIHAATVAVATNTTYTFFVRCTDDEGNINTDDYMIQFEVPEYPDGVPGVSGDDEGEGSGTGTGSGESDPGSGDPSGGDTTSGGATGGGGGGGGGGGSGPSSGGSGGGGGIEGQPKPYQSGEGRVIINGYAFPRSSVSVLVDGYLARTVQTATDGSFSAIIDAIARGAYTFGVYGTDKNGVKSSTYSTTFTVTGARGSTLSNVNVMPSIKVTPNPVDPGTALRVEGYTIPNATVTIENQNDKSSASLKSFTATSDSNGAWSVSIDTTGFAKGTYKVRAKAKNDTVGVSTNYSAYTFYGVGEAVAQNRSSDLNRDGKVNLIDFSILLYWWGSAGGNSNPPADINGDGKVSLTDFSIMIFNWTG